MATIYGESNTPPRKKIKITKNKSGVAGCSTGEGCDVLPKIFSGTPFSTKSKYAMRIRSTTSEEDGGKVEKPGGQMHMNARDLGEEPGMPSYNSGSDRNPAERKKSEIKLTKARKYFKK